MRTFKSKGGFTLVELIVVIAILAILAAVAIPVYNGYIRKAQDAAAVTELDAIATAAQAANATAVAITKITVSDSDKTIVVEADEFSSTYADDFELFYGDAASAALDDKEYTFVYADAFGFEGTSYSGYATWDGAKWTGVEADD